MLEMFRHRLRFVSIEVATIVFNAMATCPEAGADDYAAAAADVVGLLVLFGAD